MGCQLRIILIIQGDTGKGPGDSGWVTGVHLFENDCGVMREGVREDLERDSKENGGQAIDMGRGIWAVGERTNTAKVKSLLVEEERSQWWGAE